MRNLPPLRSKAAKRKMQTYGTFLLRYSKHLSAPARDVWRWLAVAALELGA